MALLVACATEPNVDEALNAPPTSTHPELVGARGPLTRQQSKAVLDRLRQQGSEPDILQRHLAIEQALAESPLVVGNKTMLLRNGAESFKAIFATIRSARRHVNLEYFIFENVESDGEHLGDLLLGKRREGVQINILYDSYGSSATPSAFFDELKQAGVNLLAFNPLNPLDARGTYSVNDRDHRKILVVDGTTAIVGGVNLSTTYESFPMTKALASTGQAPDFWRDTDMEITGPAVVELQKLFISHWNAQKGPPLEDASFFPHIAPAGNEIVRVVGSTPENATPRYYVTLLSAMDNAEKNIWITTGYFVPTHQETEYLIDAAGRGVDVRLLLPGKSDSDLALNVGHSHYDELLERGVKIYETPNEILHSKTAVIDGAWSAVGSSNFDHRSILFNDEVDVVVLGSDTARQLEEMYENDLKGATEIELKAWEDRPLSQKIEELLSRVWTNLL